MAYGGGRHALSPERLLFTWNLFQGVPKFYRDAVNLGVLAAHRGDLLKALFFDETAPLKNEAEAWFLKALRGRCYWDRQGTEIDLVALNEGDRTLRLGSCKRNPAKLVADLPAFDAHVARFLAAMPRFAGWKVEGVAVTPRHTDESRRAVQEKGYRAEDLTDLVSGM